MNTDKALEILSKVTSLPSGLFQEQSNRKVGALQSVVFYCDVEGDEYNMLINAKDEVLEIKCSSQSWRQDIIKALTAPPPVAAPTPAPPVAQAQLGSTPPPPPRTMPATVNVAIPYAAMVQFIIDYIKLNPGCVQAESATTVNETELYIPTLWNLYTVEGDDQDSSYSFTATLSGGEEVHGTARVELNGDITDVELYVVEP